MNNYNAAELELLNLTLTRSVSGALATQNCANLTFAQQQLALVFGKI
jgi:hypothetical protein